MQEVRTYSRDETVNVGRKLGKLLGKGDIVCINGGLGSGKTVFTCGIAASLGISGYVTSPTFTIVNEYDSEIPLYHFDVYRLEHPEDMFEIGFDEYIAGDGITVIEWANLIEAVLPEERISVNIAIDEESMKENARIISISFIGGKYSGYEDWFKGGCDI